MATMEYDQMSTSQQCSSGNSSAVAQACVNDYLGYPYYQYPTYAWQFQLTDTDVDRIADRVVAKLNGTKDPLCGLTKAERVALIERLAKSL